MASYNSSVSYLAGVLWELRLIYMSLSQQIHRINVGIFIIIK